MRGAGFAEVELPPLKPALLPELTSASARLGLLLLLRQHGELLLLLADLGVDGDLGLVRLRRRASARSRSRLLSRWAIRSSSAARLRNASGVALLSSIDAGRQPAHPVRLRGHLAHLGGQLDQPAPRSPSARRPAPSAGAWSCPAWPWPRCAPWRPPPARPGAAWCHPRRAPARRAAAADRRGSQRRAAASSERASSAGDARPPDEPGPGHESVLPSTAGPRSSTARRRLRRRRSAACWRRPPVTIPDRGAVGQARDLERPPTSTQRVGTSHAVPTPAPAQPTAVSRRAGRRRTSSQICSLAATSSPRPSSAGW